MTGGKPRQKVSHDAARSWPGWVTFIAPLVALVGMIRALWILLPPQWFETRTLSTLDPEKLDGFARAIDGSMNFSIMSAAIWVAGPLAVAISWLVVYRTLSARAAWIALAIAAVVGSAVAWQEWSPVGPDCQGAYSPGKVPVSENTGFRGVVIDNVMCIAERSHSPGEPVLAKTQDMIVINTYIGFIGAAAVLVAFAALAMRRQGWPDVARLRRRLDDFRTLSLMAGVLFVLNALVTKALVSWAQGLLASETDAAAFGRLGNALLNYWAAQASTVLLFAVACAAFFIQWDIGEAAALVDEHGAVGDFEARGATRRHQTKTSATGDRAAVKWKDDNKLTFDSATVLTATLGTIAPFLAGPAVDLVAKALH